MKSLIRIRDRPPSNNLYEEEKRFLRTLHGKRGSVIDEEADVLVLEDASGNITTEEGLRIVAE